MTLYKYLEQRHIDLDSGRSCLALEREYWQALEVLAYEDGWNNWRDFFYMRILPDKPKDISLASHVRKMVTVFLFDEFDERRSSDGTVYPNYEEPFSCSPCPHALHPDYFISPIRSLCLSIGESCNVHSFAPIGEDAL